MTLLQSSAASPKVEPLHTIVQADKRVGSQLLAKLGKIVLDTLRVPPHK